MFLKRTINAGDFNCCLKDGDRSSNTHINDKSRAYLAKYIESLDFVDCTSIPGNEAAGKFTWTYSKVSSRLDYFLNI